VRGKVAAQRTSENARQQDVYQNVPDMQLILRLRRREYVQLNGWFTFIAPPPDIFQCQIDCDNRLGLIMPYYGFRCPLFCFYSGRNLILVVVVFVALELDRGNAGGKMACTNPGMLEGELQFCTRPCRIKLDSQCTSIKGKAIAFIAGQETPELVNDLSKDLVDSHEVGGLVLLPILLSQEEFSIFRGERMLGSVERGHINEGKTKKVRQRLVASLLYLLP